MEKTIDQTWEFKPIGYVRHNHREVPRHWSASNLEGELVIKPEYQAGLVGLKTGDFINVIFVFHQSPPFKKEKILQKPPHSENFFGVFNLCSPLRPNPIGLSVLKVLSINRNLIRVEGVDIFDGSPILDIKPYIAYRIPNSG
ncbi:MAG: tRNA (N6-threonylcarbamoyladenosine(37)-N6)-methyltransferase TrmO [Candidatus Saccharicenans sp.]|nr:tRNA (N6-threonylcarbamoyladenosine(37)-N6)-methyltransferase TrmO [Candidatus Saccharicenans sp.]MDI6849327.1 tRNA (N6-threonylcarbamoyladenosine(37)-N6)-methyltransferase TrmO [Candidatus Saccharicenans sp.]